jgi:ABC-type branched-subunit amino acid transport system substrate-binding protein
MLSLSPEAAHAQSKAEAAEPPLAIPVFISSREDQCFDSGLVPAIKQLTMAEQRRINAAGGVLRRQVKVEFMDDQRNQERTIANLKEALKNPNTIAMIGLANSNLANAAFDAVGGAIGESGIPFLSDISVNNVFEKHANVYTMRPSQDEERVPVMSAFMNARGAERPAFVGVKGQGSFFSTSLGDGLVKAKINLVADHRLALQNNKIEPAVIAAAVADLKQKNPDMIVLAVGSLRTAAFLAALVEAGVTPPLLVTGRIDTIFRRGGASEYPGDIFQLGWDDLPDLFSDRLRERIARNGLDRWIFAGEKVASAPGWKTGECKAPAANQPPSVFESRNMIAIGRGTQYADMVALIADALKTADPASTVSELRAHILKELRTNYSAGRGMFRGSFENWSFRPTSRSADRTPFIVMRPQGLGASQLAPLQFVRLRSDKLRQIDTLYLDIDLIRTFRIEDNDKTFFAEFYLSMRGANASIKNIEFANAALDPKTTDRQITIRPLHEGGDSDVYPREMHIYQVAGKFTFEPRLAAYPFDTQRFSIEIRPKSSAAPFIVQPPPRALRDTAAETDGWAMQDQYVGYDEGFVPTVDAWTFKQSVVPFYKASYVWLMRRQTTDYYLRVVVPLAFIVLVAYLSIFIPLGNFEAIVTIQVTALLSAVALYLALPKVEADDGTTVSDRIFLFVYSVVSLMIVISILRVSRPVERLQWVRKVLGLAHIVIIPLLVASMTLYVYRLSIGEPGAASLMPRIEAGLSSLMR